MNYQNPYAYQNHMYPMNNGIIWVQGTEGAKAYQLSPNSNVILMDSEIDGRFYIKVADNVGMCTLRTFKFEEITNMPTSSAKEVDLSQFITREEFEKAISNLGGGKNGKQSIPTNDTKLITK